MKEVDACSCHINTLIYRYLIYVYSMRCHGIISRPYVYSYYVFHHYSDPHYFTVFPPYQLLHRIMSLSFLLFIILSFILFDHCLFSVYQRNHYPLHQYLLHQKQLISFHSIQLSPLFVHFSILGLVIVLLILFLKRVPYIIIFQPFSLQIIHHITQRSLILSPPSPSLLFSF